MGVAARKIMGDMRRALVGRRPTADALPPPFTRRVVPVYVPPGELQRRIRIIREIKRGIRPASDILAL